MAHKLSDVRAQHLTGETKKAAQDQTSFCKRPRPPPLTCRRLTCRRLNRLSRSAAVAAQCTEVQHTAPKCSTLQHTHCNTALTQLQQHTNTQPVRHTSTQPQQHTATQPLPTHLNTRHLTRHFQLSSPLYACVNVPGFFCKTALFQGGYFSRKTSHVIEANNRGNPTEASARSQLGKKRKNQRLLPILLGSWGGRLLVALLQPFILKTATHCNILRRSATRTFWSSAARRWLRCGGLFELIKRPTAR